MSAHQDDTNNPTLFWDFQHGDPGAANTVFLRYAQPLCFFVERLTGSLPDAQDIVADTFIKLLERRGQFNDLDNVRAFLYHAARNAALNHLRSNSRHAAAHRQLAYLAQGGVGAEPSGLENEFIRLEVLGDIYEEIDNLPGKCRDIFKAIFLEGRSNEDIAEDMGIAVQTVRTQKARALQLLRAELFKKGKWMAYLLILSRLHPPA